MRGPRLPPELSLTRGLARMRACPRLRSALQPRSTSPCTRPEAARLKPAHPSRLKPPRSSSEPPRPSRRPHPRIRARRSMTTAFLHPTRCICGHQAERSGPRLVASRGNSSWSHCGAPWLQPVASAGKRGGVDRIRSRRASPAQRDHRVMTQPSLVTVSAVYRPRESGCVAAAAHALALRRDAEHLRVQTMPVRGDAGLHDSQPHRAAADDPVQRVLEPVQRARKTETTRASPALAVHRSTGAAFNILPCSSG
jgi:hypothetical protein